MSSGARRIMHAISGGTYLKLDEELRDNDWYRRLVIEHAIDAVYMSFAVGNEYEAKTEEYTDVNKAKVLYESLLKYKDSERVRPFIDHLKSEIEASEANGKRKLEFPNYYPGHLALALEGRSEWYDRVKDGRLPFSNTRLAAASLEILEDVRDDSWLLHKDTKFLWAYFDDIISSYSPS